MKKSEAVRIMSLLCHREGINVTWNLTTEQFCEEMLDGLIGEGIMTIKQYVNPIARKDPNISFERGDGWAYIEYISKYPEHYYTYKNKRPYEFYLDGWEPED